MTYSLVLNVPQIDWLTMTTYEDVVFDHWLNAVIPHEGKIEERAIGDRWQNYIGVQKKERGGSWFLGSGEQKGRVHSCLWVSGALADKLFLPAIHANTQHSGTWEVEQPKTTRLDIQITILEPNDWNQWEFATALKKRGRLPQVRASRDTDSGLTLETVYTGQMGGGDKLVRVYQKLGDGNVPLLRIEAQYTNGRRPGKANTIARRVSKFDGQDGLRVALRDEVQLLDCPMLTDAFMPHLGGFDVTGITRINYSRDNNTRRWLLQSVVPSLERYLNKNTDDMELQEIFLKVLRSRKT